MGHFNPKTSSFFVQLGFRRSALKEIILSLLMSFSLTLARSFERAFFPGNYGLFTPPYRRGKPYFATKGVGIKIKGHDMNVKSTILAGFLTATLMSATALAHPDKNSNDELAGGQKDSKSSVLRFKNDKDGDFEIFLDGEEFKSFDMDMFKGLEHLEGLAHLRGLSGLGALKALDDLDIQSFETDDGDMKIVIKSGKNGLFNGQALFADKDFESWLGNESGGDDNVNISVDDDGEITITKDGDIIETKDVDGAIISIDKDTSVKNGKRKTRITIEIESEVE